MSINSDGPSAWFACRSLSGREESMPIARRKSRKERDSSMTKRNSRFPGFHKITVLERRELVAEATGTPVEEMNAALETGGLDPVTADKFVENVLGTYALPFGVALNVRVNGKDYVVPMVVEEPSVIAAASNAAKMVRAGGGFSADVDPPIMTCQVQVFDVADIEGGAERIEREKA